MPFKPGQSGNPKGRKPKTESDKQVETLAKTYTSEAIDVLVKWMRSDDPQASGRAACALLDRGWGKPSQTVTATVTKHIVTDERLIAARNSLRRAQEPENRTVQ